MVNQNDKKSLFFNKEKQYIESVNIFSVHTEDEILYFLDKEDIRESVKNKYDIKLSENFIMKVYFKKLKYKENMDIVGNNIEIDIDNYNEKENDKNKIIKNINFARFYIERFLKTIQKIEITGNEDLFVVFEKDEILNLEPSLLAIINTIINSKL